MTRDEIRSLIGGYATGSLSASEREALFEAALDDQELFDELAREQALKELLEQPGVTTRLISGLSPTAPTQRTPQPTAWWSNIWVWVTAGAFGAALIMSTALFETEPPQQIAQVTAPARPFRTPALPEPVVPKRELPPVSIPPPIVIVPAAPPPVFSRDVIPTIPAPVAKTATAAKTEGVKAEGTLVRPGPAPIPPAAQAGASTSTGALGTGNNPLGAGRGGGGGGGVAAGGRGGAVNRALTQPQAAFAPAPLRFAFDYSVTPEGSLRIVPASNGFLTVGANNGTAVLVLFENRSLQAGSVTEVPLPADCVSAVVIFSAQMVPAGSSNLVTGALDAASGTKADSNPTPESRLTAVIPVRR